MRRPRPRELRAFFSCMAWRAIPGPLSKRKRRLDSLEAAQLAPRDPRRDSRGERSPWLPLETRPDSPGGYWEGPSELPEQWSFSSAPRRDSVFLPGKSHGPRSLEGYSLWGCKESDMSEQLHFTCMPGCL